MEHVVHVLGHMFIFLCDIVDIWQRLDIMKDVVFALDYLHYGYSTPMVHCDLKPSNVLLDDDMVGHVSDFGIAKLLGVEETVAQTKTLATIGHIAPGNIECNSRSHANRILFSFFLFIKSSM